MVFDFDKFKAAIHYVCNKAAEANVVDRLDPIRLNKVLWYSECMAYLSRGEPIFGATFIRKQHGPAPRAQPAAVNALEKDGAIKTGQRKDDKGKYHPCYDVIAEPTKGPFSGQELDIMDRVFKAICLEMGPFEASERSHGEIWHLYKMDTVLPLHMVFAEKARNPTPEQMRLATVDLAA